MGAFPRGLSLYRRQQNLDEIKSRVSILSRAKNRRISRSTQFSYTQRNKEGEWGGERPCGAREAGRERDKKKRQDEGDTEKEREIERGNQRDAKGGSEEGLGSR